METTVEASMVFRGNVQIPHPRIINVPKVVYTKIPGILTLLGCC